MNCMNILIVDSSISIIERIEELLQESKQKNQFFIANSFDTAKELNENNTIHIVLLDMDLPQNKSIKLIEKIKKKNSNTVVIALYNSSDSFLEHQYKMEGANFLLDKYHDFEKLPTIINDLKATMIQ